MSLLLAVPAGTAGPTETLAAVPPGNAGPAGLLVALPPGIPEPAEPGAAPCHWFDYSLAPPGYHLRVHCLVKTVLDLVP